MSTKWCCHVLWLFPYCIYKRSCGDWQETLMSKPVSGCLATRGAPKAVGGRAASYLSWHKGCLETLDRIQHSWLEPSAEQSTSGGGTVVSHQRGQEYTWLVLGEWQALGAQPTHHGERTGGNHLCVILAPLPRVKHCSQSQPDHQSIGSGESCCPWEHTHCQVKAGGVKRMIFTHIMGATQEMHRK